MDAVRREADMFSSHVHALQTGAATCVLLSVQSLCVHFQSYSGNMRVILAGRKEMFPDLGAFASCFVTSFQRLHADATRHS